jgi:hypothetical protein
MIQSRRDGAEQILIAEFIKDLESTAGRVEVLLEEVHKSKLDFVSIKSELGYLVENVTKLWKSPTIDDADGLLTRLAVIENSLQYVKTYVDKEVTTNNMLITKIALLEQKLEQSIIVLTKEKASGVDKQHTIDEIRISGKWKLYVVIATGVFTLLGSIAALIISLL